MKWIKAKEYKTDGQANRLVVKTKEGNLALFTHTGSAISQISMTDQYEIYLDETAPDEKDKEIERLKKLIESLHEEIDKAYRDGLNAHRLI